MKKIKLISVALFSLITLSTAHQSVASAEGANSEKAVVEESGDKKVAIDDNVKNEAEKAAVVQGADGLMYVVVDEIDPKKLLEAESPLNNEQENTGSVEVGVDKKRQEEADQANEKVKDFEDVDYNDISSLQSALNNPKFPFLSDDDLKEQLSKAKDTFESEELIKKTRGYFSQRILELGNNLNDVPQRAKVNRRALVSTRASKVSETRINPPSGYPWVIYLVRSNGYSYTENYAIRRTIDGKEAFCLQAGVTATNTYTGSASGYLSNSQKELISSFLSAYKELGGWANNDSGKQRWIATQILVWENSNEKPKSITVTPNWKSGVTKSKSDITARANTIRVKPTWDANSKTVYEGEKTTFTVKNTGGEHKLKVESVSGGGKATISGNKLTVDTSGSTGTQIVVKMTKGSTELNPTTVWSNGSYQKLVTGSFYVNTSVTVNVKRKGTVEVLKIDSETKKPLAGATFRFSYSGINKDVTTDSNGKAKLTERLKAGTVVKVKEIKAPNGYQLDSSEFSITVKENQNVTTTRTNKRSTGSVEIEKLGDLDGLGLPNVVFTIYSSDNKVVKDNLKTDSNGKIKVDELQFGKYYAVEKQGVTGYDPDGKKYNFEITQDTPSTKPAKVKVTNIYQVSISEKVSDMNESQVLKNVWSADPNDYLQYDITTGNLKKSGERNVQSFIIEGFYDNKNVDVLKSEVYVGSTNVTNSFDISNDTGNGKVTAKAKATVLTNNDFYNKSYNLRITMKIKKSTIENTEKQKPLTIVKNSKVTVGSKISKSASSNDVETVLYSRKITINHIDEKDKHLLKQDIDYKYDGETYEYKPRTDLFDKDGNNYKSDVIQKGKINGKDIVLTTPYHIPALSVNVDRIQIDTSRAVKNGFLPTELELSKKEEYGNELSKIVFKVKITDIDSNKVVYDNNFKYKEFSSHIKLNLPTEYLTKNKKVNYSISILLVENPEKNKFDTETKDLKTIGYTSSEKVLTNKDMTNNQVNYSAVVRTVKERANNNPVKEFRESINYKFTDTTKTKTGYGISVDLEPTYKNEIGKQIDMKVYSYPMNELIDSKIDEIYQPIGEKEAEVKMDRLKNESKVESGTNTQILSFQFPHMNVERKTGNVYADSQKNDESIKYELIDGGRKLYVPIWCDLGKYSIAIKSSNFGGNYISLDMNQSIDVYAYMYATIDSETKKEDELLLEPVYPETTLPDNWSNKEIDWLNK
ncbi:TPA: SpaA isopeptide-forming pilin-related protein [Enterococcus faecium]|uniref:MSCRAMM family protein n=1 Tax=Enterococcus faecium TaxID=1352 RepID=UPI0010C4DB87|nr:SpaA isopeptide-forming pilin-related protein [Enterococcus faecium]NTK97487.1 hypothetical protein [Enterococcus faecium]NTN38511.1 hypothetical protein [Enterococcus faecium]NTP62005.1 hypothetical protein [Enterococcus faecium]QBF50942.1 hypothetical protein EXV96_15505 [Enterococcus faecium]HAQ8189903.1 hypothetical protein [Enterococcus faecium]